MLSSRKNLQGGSGVLRRACCCSGNQDMCPVHVLWEQFLANVPVGTSPWQHISPAQVVKWIRAALVALAVGICLHLQCAICAALTCRYQTHMHMERIRCVGDMLEYAAFWADPLLASRFASWLR